ncbi:uncharacterized protein LOC127095148 [Lathyrus oleraceus]|uniref:uncharacterized protein LOC127095148 n=1 Tax=Pisum sativum TaxID=3888 RepID=UPI0021CF13F3|nr:uncharacterized protein LOC127095148 [Pisum sativum]
MVHPPPHKKATPSVSKHVKTYGKSSEPIIPNKDKNTIEEESRSKWSEKRNPSMHADDTENPTDAERSETGKELRKFIASVLREVNTYVFPDVQTSLTKEPSPDNDSSEKDEESIPEHAARERRNSPSREVKRKVGGLKGTPSRSSTGKSLGGPTRSWIKVVTPTRKRKVVSSSESEFDVEKDVQDITLIKIFANKKPNDAMPKVPLDNAYSHYVENVERWKYVIQRSVALERELGKDALKFKEVMELIEVVGLIKTVTHVGPCYESLVKEFVVTIHDGCDDTKSADYGKVYVRGNFVTFSPTVIHKYLGKIDVPRDELEATDDQVSKEITTKQALGPATSKKSVIAQLKETCKELKDSIRSSTVTKIKLETLMKAMMKEKKKEVVQGGDSNEVTDDEFYVGEDDVDEEKEDERE